LFNRLELAPPSSWGFSFETKESKNGKIIKYSGKDEVKQGDIQLYAD
jgi:hypothetical protein